MMEFSLFTVQIVCVIIHNPKFAKHRTSAETLLLSIIFIRSCMKSPIPCSKNYSQHYGSITQMSHQKTTGVLSEFLLFAYFVFVEEIEDPSVVH